MNQILRRLLAPGCLLLVPALALASPEKATSATSVQGVSVYLKDGRKLPLFAESSEPVPVAQVGDEIVTMRELADGLAAAHMSHGEAAHAQKRDAQVIVDRLVDLRLIALEARAMGIGDLPEYKTKVEAFRATTLRDVLKEGYTRSLKPDRKKVEKVYQDAVREWKVRSLLFAAESDAREFASKVKAGGMYDVLSAEAVAQKKAQSSGQADLLPEKKMLPEVLAAVRKLAPGELSAPLKVGPGWAVVLLEGQQFPDNPDQRAAAEWKILQARHNEELVRQYQVLVKKYAKIDKQLLKKLDFEATKPGLQALLKDRRPLVQIQGESPVRVADLAKEVQATYFHGAERAAGGKTKKALNLRKESTLDNLLGRRLFAKEALARKVQDSPTFRYRLQDYQNSLLVGGGIERAVAPEVQVTEADERARYEAHKAEYSYPQFFRVEGLVFGDARDAQAAVAKLRAGTDFQFMARNADRRMDPDAAQLKFNGVLSAAELPLEVQKSLAGAKSGEYRIHDDGGEHHVVHVIEEIPPRARPFDEVRAEVRSKVASEKLGQAVKEWVAKLRKAYPVEIYVARVGE